MAKFNKNDIRFVLEQIKIAEQNRYISWNTTTNEGEGGADLLGLVGDPLFTFGLRTVDGTFNNLVPGQQDFGAADTLFPRLLPQRFLNDADGDSVTLAPAGASGPGSPALTITNTNYAALNLAGTATRSVVDADPRIISNLIVDQSSANHAAVAAFNAQQPEGTPPQLVQPRKIPDPSNPSVLIDNPDFVENLFVQNIAPDEGLSAPFNSWMTLFGQFFDHGLDLVTKGDNGTVYMPLQPDDPLYDFGANGIVDGDDGFGADGVFNTADDRPNYMAMTRATNINILPGQDGVLGTADDIHDHENTTTSWIDQNQTYTSHPSHQAFLREYVLTANGPVATGNLLEGAGGGLATWADIKLQARTILGIELSDFDVHNVPLLATDQYGKLILSPLGQVQMVTTGGIVFGDTGNPVTTETAIGTNHAFLNDIAHHAAPNDKLDHDRNPGTPTVEQTADTDLLDFNSDGVIDQNDVIAGTAGIGPGFLSDANGDSVIDLADLADVNLDGVINIADLTADDRNPLTYDNELLDAHYITGDGRGNENIGLTSVHHIFHSEHNRQVEEIKATIIADAQETGDLTALNDWLAVDVPALPGDLSTLTWDGERLFQAARFATEMQYQHLVFEEFGRKVQPAINVFAGIETDADAAIVAEFAHTVYRFGHSMLTETVDRIDANGNPVLASNGEQIGLIEAFLNPLEYAARGASGAAAAEVVRGMTRQAGNEIDEFVTGALQNNLVGLPLDLAAINIARGRDTGIPSLNSARSSFFAITGDTRLEAYDSWNDFGANIKHPESLVNFIAAYGKHSTITSATTLEGKRDAAMLLVYGNMDINGDGISEVAPADRLQFLASSGAWANTGTLPKDADGVSTTGLGDVDFWIGGLAEKQLIFGGLLGSTFGYVFEKQMELLQDNDRLYYLARNAGLNFLTELEGNSFAELIMRNLPGVKHLPGDVFSTPDHILEINQADQIGADPVGEVVRNNPNTPGPDSNYLQYTGDGHVVLGGTESNDILVGGIGDDTLWGDGGNDRLEGGDGNDQHIGGDGDDIITDEFGDDNIKGGAGNDVINAGAGIDLIIAGDGDDYVFAGVDEKETFGGEGNDYIFAGDGSNTVFGDGGDDWIDGGAGADLLQGDNGDPFQTSQIIGNDVVIGGSGNDDYDMESGDDIGVSGVGVERYEGMWGFDWVTAQGDMNSAGVPNVIIADLTQTEFTVPESDTIRDRFDAIEALSGWDGNDILGGDNLTTTELGAFQTDALGNPIANSNNALNNAEQIALIDGLQGLLDGMLGAGQTSFSAGNILLGGGGSDTIEGRGGNDLIDGDKWLGVQLSYIDANNVEQRTSDMASIKELMFSGALNPSDLKIVREINNANGGTDTAVYSLTNSLAVANSLNNEYDWVQNANGTWTVTHNLVDETGAVVTPEGGANGIDTLRNIEQLEFRYAGIDGVFGDDIGTVGVDESLDDQVQVVSLVSGLPANQAATGSIAVTGTPGTEGVVLTASLLVDGSGVIDPNTVGIGSDGINNASVRFDWQVETAPTVWSTVRYNSDTFTPDDGQVGKNLRVVATFEDDQGNLESITNVVAVGLNGVINVNDAPSSSTQEVTVNEGGAYAFTVADFGFTDPDAGDSLKEVVINSLPTAGTLTLAGNAVNAGDSILAAQIPDLEFTPAANANGADYASFDFTVRDQSDASSASHKMWVNVNAVNDAPTGQDKTLSIAEDTSYTFTKDDFGFADIDAGDDLRAVKINSLPAGGSLTLNGVAVALDQVILVTAIIAEQLVYTPVANGNGYPAPNSEYANFDFTVQDLSGTPAAASNTMTINVTQVNDVATGSLAISDLTPTELAPLTASQLVPIADIDVLGILNYQWQSSVDGNVWTNILGATSSSFTPAQAQVNRFLRVNVSFVDGDGNNELITSPATGVVGENYNGNNSANNPALTNGEDIANGNGGADILRGLAGIDILNGGAGNDNIDGGNDNDTIDGGVGSDILLGGDGDDIIRGGANVGATIDGNDTLVGGAGADTMTGGDGNDTYEVDNIGDQVIETNAALTQIDTVETTLTSYTLGANVENLNFTDVDPIAFTGTGNALNNRIEGGDGDDILDGGAGRDTLIGGLGNDTYVVDLGPSDAAGDIVTEAAGQGNDTVLSSVTYTIGANIENLTLTGTANINGTGNTLDNVLTGNSGNNTLDGSTGADTINGGAGNDTLIGGTGNTIDTINGEAGDDLIQYTVGQGADVVDGGADTDTLVISGTTGNDTLSVFFDGDNNRLTRVGGGNVSNLEVVTADLGTGTADLLSYNGPGGTTANVTVNLATGNASGFAANSIVGIENVTTGSGSDSITGAIGAVLNTLSGGAGDDSYFVDGGETISEAAAAGTDTVFATLANGVGYTITDADVENLTLLDTTNSNATGNASNNVLTGNTGNNVLSGLGGVDTLLGGDGADDLTGGAANDIINGEAGNDTIRYTMGDGSDTIDGGADSDTLIVTGTAGNDVLDVIFNGTNITSLEGGLVTGIESIVANLLGQAVGGADTLSYVGTTVAVSVDLTANSASGFSNVSGIEVVTGGSGGDTLTGNSAAATTLNGGAGDDSLTGGSLNDILSGGDNNDILTGNDGIDTLNGGNNNDNLFGGIGADILNGDAGDDVIDGGLGNDTINGGAGANDTVSYANETDGMVVDIALGTARRNGVLEDAISQIENITTGSGDDTLTSNGNNNTLDGGDGNDLLQSGGGIDRLIGGLGNDTLNSGAGNDFHVYNSLLFGNDTIELFDAIATGGQDLLDFSGLGLTAADIGGRIGITSNGVDSVVTVDGTETITLVGVNGVGANAIEATDFLFG